MLFGDFLLFSSLPYANHGDKNIFNIFNNERDVQNPCKRRDINSGMHVRIVEKKNQKEGITTDGIVARILTNSSEHSHGIKVQLSNGAVGRVKEIISIG